MQIKDAISFIRTYDKGFCKLWSDSTLCHYILQAIDCQCFIWYGDSNGLHGIALGHWKDSNTIHVELFVAKPQLTCKFIHYLIQLYPGKDIVGYRHGKLKNLTKIIHHYGRT